MSIIQNVIFTFLSCLAVSHSVLVLSAPVTLDLCSATLQAEEWFTWIVSFAAPEAVAFPFLKCPLSGLIVLLRSPVRSCLQLRRRRLLSVVTFRQAPLSPVAAAFRPPVTSLPACGPRIDFSSGDWTLLHCSLQWCPAHLIPTVCQLDPRATRHHPVVLFGAACLSFQGGGAAAVQRFPVGQPQRQGEGVHLNPTPLTHPRRQQLPSVEAQVAHTGAWFSFGVNAKSDIVSLSVSLALHCFCFIRVLACH